MGLRETINKMIGLGKPEVATSLLQAPASTNPPQASAFNLAVTFGAEQDRQRMLDTCMQMYRSDPRVKKMHRQLGRDIVKGGYYLRCQDGHAMEVAKSMQERLKLNDLLDDYVRMSARDGDLFLQLEIDPNLNIIGITRKPVRSMHRNSNGMDTFDNPARAFWMDTNPIGTIYSPQPPQDALFFAEWEIIHARWEHDQGERYGCPMMASGMTSYKMVTEGERDVAVRRKTRSGLRYVHTLEGASAGDLQTYKEVNQQALAQPFAAIADFFTNKKGSISVVQGDGDLEKIGDVQHHIATMFAAGEVPMELVAYGQDISRDTLAEKKEEYDETLDVLRKWLSTQIIVPLLERQWLLAGILPESVKYSVEWRYGSDVKAQDIKDITDAAMRLRILGYNEEVVKAIVSRFLPNIDPEMLDAGSNDPAAAQRMADIMQQMRGGLA